VPKILRLQQNLLNLRLSLSVLGIIFPTPGQSFTNSVSKAHPLRIVLSHFAKATPQLFRTPNLPQSHTMQKRSLILFAALLSSIPISAAPVSTGSWYHVLTGLPSVDGTNGVAGGSGANAYLDPGAGPWTFSLLNAGTLDVVDGQNPGETYNVFNGNTLLGLTLQGSIFDPFTSCGLAPQDCFTTPDVGNAPVYSRRTYNLLANTPYSIRIQAVDAPAFGSSVFFRVNGTLGTNNPPPPPPPPPPPGGDPNAIPEPTTYALTGTAFAALAWLKSRKR